MLSCLLDFFDGLGGDDHVVNVEAHIDVVVIVALDVDTLICSTASRSNLQNTVWIVLFHALAAFLRPQIA